MIRMFAMISIGLVSAGCTSMSLELAHTSHPLAGPPLHPEILEDSIDAVQFCMQREKSLWYVENCLGYIYVENGFLGPRFIYQGRIGRKWRIGR